MALVYSLVASGPNHLRYLMTAAGAETAALPIAGGATPDVLTDAPGGQIKRIAQCFDNGYGKLAAGALNQAKARALWLSDDPTNLVGTGVPRAICTTTARTAITFALDADVDGNGEPELNAAASGAGTGYLDIYIPGAIGQ